MDTLRGKFADGADPADDRAFDADDEDLGLDRPASPVGDDERRMQVRAYNHWASLIQDRNFPSIDDLDPDSLPDFGPCSVLLDFSYGTENPGIAYLGDRLAAECDATDVDVNMLSDVPARSLLSRITDHYMQILSNQAPIGFEAEFVNYTGKNVLYRGILLPYSSDDDQIDFIFGVINWSYLADQRSTDELMLEIDQALEENPALAPLAQSTGWDEADEPAYDEPAAEDHVEQDPADAAEEVAKRSPIVHGLTPMGRADEVEADQVEDQDLPVPSFGWTDDDEDEGQDEEDEGDFQVSSPLPDPMPDPLPTYSPLMSKAKSPRSILPLTGLDASGEDESGYGEDDFSQDNDAEGFGPAYPELNQEALDAVEPAAEYDGPESEPAVEELELSEYVTEEELPAEEFLQDEVVDETHTGTGLAATQEVADYPASDANALGEELAAARRLADNAKDSEDRTRHALYEAIGKAYDFSLAAAEAPEEFETLIADAGLAMQERAPMTPVVKLVFGADYDKTRVTEYAAALAHAHRHRLERGELARFIESHEGGLKGVVQAERRLRREETGQPAETAQERIARQLRDLAPIEFDAIPSAGAEFALVMIRRDETGDVVVLGEVPEDAALVERAARKLLG